MSVPLPPLNFSTPSYAAEGGGVRDIGVMSVGDYYGTGSRVRQASGWGWQEIAVIGVVALVAYRLYKR